MSVDQGKLVHQLIIVTNAFLRLINKREEKVYACHPIGTPMSEVISG